MIRPILLASLLLLALSPPPQAEGRSMAHNIPTYNELPTGIYAGSDNNIHKRIMFDSSCKGVFDPESYRKLDQVCEECFYLYYDEGLTARCRQNCFRNRSFEYCVQDLQHPEDEYIELAQRLHSKTG